MPLENLSGDVVENDDDDEYTLRCYNMAHFQGVEEQYSCLYIGKFCGDVDGDDDEECKLH